MKESVCFWILHKGISMFFSKQCSLNPCSLSSMSGMIWSKFMIEQQNSKSFHLTNKNIFQNWKIKKIFMFVFRLWAQARPDAALLHCQWAHKMRRWANTTRRADQGGGIPAFAIALILLITCSFPAQWSLAFNNIRRTESRNWTQTRLRSWR